MVRVFDAPIIVHDQSLERVLAAPIPVMLVFWKNEHDLTSLGGALAKLAEIEAGNLLVGWVKTIDSPNAVGRFAIRNTPYAVGVKDGKSITHGALDDGASELKAHVDYLLGRGGKPPAQQERMNTANRINGSATGIPVDVTDATFEREVLKSSTPVVVDFWAAWCGPCRQIAPVISSLAGEYAGRIKFAKVNVDQNAHFAGQYGIQGIPTLLIFKNGQMVRRLVGVRPASELRTELDRL